VRLMESSVTIVSKRYIDCSRYLIRLDTLIVHSSVFQYSSASAQNFVGTDNIQIVDVNGDYRKVRKQDI
jgi:hypothetical protein